MAMTFFVSSYNTKFKAGLSNLGNCNIELKRPKCNMTFFVSSYNTKFKAGSSTKIQM